MNNLKIKEIFIKNTNKKFLKAKNLFKIKK